MAAHKLPASTTHRLCKACNQVLPLEAFPRHKDKALGRAYQCKPCRNDHEKRHERMRIRTEQSKSLLYPMPAMTLAESLDCVRLRKWGRYEGAPRGQLTPALRMQG